SCAALTSKSEFRISNSKISFPLQARFPAGRQRAGDTVCPPTIQPHRKRHSVAPLVVFFSYFSWFSWTFARQTCENPGSISLTIENKEPVWCCAFKTPVPFLDALRLSFSQFAF